MKTVILLRDELLNAVTEEICRFIREKPDAVMTMAAGRTMFPVWESLALAVRAGKLSLKNVRFFQTAEFIGARRENSLRGLVEDRLFPTTDFEPANCSWFEDFETVDDCENAIREAGGLDLAVLGIGVNAHIGLNEPGTQFQTCCRVQKLTNSTKNQYTWLFGGPEKVPEKACTMGIQTLLGARKILLASLGAEKAKATFDMLYARNDSVVPAAFLQLHRDVTVYADPEAGEQL